MKKYCGSCKHFAEYWGSDWAEYSSDCLLHSTVIRTIKMEIANFLEKPCPYWEIGQKNIRPLDKLAYRLNRLNEKPV